MKIFIAVALALLVGAGAGYGIFAGMGGQTTDTAPTPTALESAQSIAAETAKVEPAAQEEKVHGADDPVVGKVDGNPIYRTDVLEFIKTLPPQMQQTDVKQVFPMALDQVISGRIVDTKALAEGLDSNPEVLKRLADAKTQIIRGVYAEQSIAKEFSQEAVQKAYDEIVKNIPKVDEVHARHILVDTEDQAKDIISKLSAGAKFEDLAKEFSKDKSNSASGGDLGYFAQTDMVKEFADAAFSMKANEFSKAPVKTQFGFHVIQSLDKRARPAPKLDDIKPQLESQVRRDILTKLVEKWRAGAAIEQFDFDGKPVVKAPEPTAATTNPAAPVPAPVEEKKAE